MPQLFTDRKNADLDILDPNRKNTGRLALCAYLTEKRTAETATNDATLTAAKVLAGILDGTPTGAAAYTLPTVATLLAALPGVKDGASFLLAVNNKSAGANTITMTTNTGWTLDGTVTVAQNVIRLFLVTITSVASATARLDGIG